MENECGWLCLRHAVRRPSQTSREGETVEERKQGESKGPEKKMAGRKQGESQGPERKMAEKKTGRE